MTIEIDGQLQRLIAAHPRLFGGQAPAVPSYVTTGWYALIDQLCCDLEALLGPEACAVFEVRQIKEKFGTLRFYYRFVGQPPKAGEDVEMVEARIRELVDAACDASETVCETCGAPAQLRDIGGYITVRCDQHYAERVALHEARRRPPSANSSEF